MDNKMKTVAARIDLARHQRLMRATDRKKDPLAPSTSQVIVRGLDLALAELEQPEKRRSVK